MSHVHSRTKALASGHVLRQQHHQELIQALDLEQQLRCAREVLPVLLDRSWTSPFTWLIPDIHTHTNFKSLSSL